MPHVKPRVALASDARPQCALVRIESARRVHQTYDAILPYGSAVRARLVRGPRGNHWYHVTREGDRTSALARLDEEMAQLVAAGADDAMLARIEAHVHETRLRLAATAVRSRDEIDRAEGAVESEENSLTLEARIEQTPTLFRRLANVCRQEAAIEAERAVVYDLEAERLERRPFMRPRGVPA